MQETYALSLYHINKSFGGIKALKDVSFELKKGEIHALLGENGAGKSTLIKIITGVHEADGGQMLIDGQEVRITSPLSAREHGIGAIYQELSLVDSLTVAENIFLGNEPTKPPFSYYNRKKLYQQCGAYLKQFDIHMDLTQKVSELGMGQKRVVEIIKALALNAKILLLDEPTTGMSNAEISILFQIVRNLKSKGISMIYISHYLDEIFTIADRATIYRDGSKISTYCVSEMTQEQLIGDMIGHSLVARQDRSERDFTGKEDVLELRDFQTELMQCPVSLHVRRSEIIGITGIIGAGKSELALSIFGAGGKHAGIMKVNGKEVCFRSPADTRAYQIALIPEDRKAQGLFLQDSIEDNVLIPNTHQMETPLKTIDNKKKYELTKEICKKLQVYPEDPQLIAGNLSGGNQQKVVLAKWLLSDPKLIVMDEPTRGIDVGAKQEIYQLITDLAAQDAAVVVMSSECEELISICDRILVLYRGKIVRELRGCDATKENLMTYSLGGSVNES